MVGGGWAGPPGPAGWGGAPPEDEHDVLVQRVVERLDGGLGGAPPQVQPRHLGPYPVVERRDLLR